MVLSNKTKKLLTTAGVGAVGTVAGTVIGFQYGRPTLGGRVGMTTGMVAGGLAASKIKSSTPEVKESIGHKAFQRRVGTRTKGRVGKRTTPVKVKVSSRGKADVGNRV